MCAIMIRKSISRIISVVFCLLTGLGGIVFSCDSTSRLDYHRETIFEIAPHAPPLNLSLELRKEGVIDEEKMLTAAVVEPTHFFDRIKTAGLSFDEEGNLVFYSREKRRIDIIAYDGRLLRSVAINPPDSQKYDYYAFGPQNELYISYYHKKYFTVLKRFDIVNGEYIENTDFKGWPTRMPAGSSIISADGYYYERNAYPQLDTCKVRVYNSRGNFVRYTHAQCKTSDGVEIILEKGSVPQNIPSKLLTYPDRKEILSIEVEISYFFGISRCTLDGLIIISGTRHDKMPVNGGIVPMWWPVVIVVDPENSAFIQIDRDDVARPDYEHLTIAAMHAAYSGDIYALVLYFNEYEKLNGDEIYVLYKWKTDIRP